jgi:hypothetical protein
MRSVEIVKGLAIVTVAVLALSAPSSVYANAKEREHKPVESKIKDGIDTTAHALKKGTEKCGDKLEDVQNYFRNKFHETTTIGPAVVSDVKFNGHHLVAIVKPGERIEGELKCVLDKSKIQDLRYHRLIIGFKDLGAQTSVSNGFGYFADKESKDKFVLIAPSQPGLYKVRYRPVETYTESEGLKKWRDDEGREPNSDTTIGLIYVKA